MDNQDKEDREQRDELARRLCAALMSINMGISPGYCYEKYMKGKPVGPYWGELAEQVMEDQGSMGFIFYDEGYEAGYIDRPR